MEMSTFLNEDDRARITELHHAVEDALAALEARDGRPGPTYMLLPAEDVRRLTKRLTALRPDDALEAVSGWFVAAAEDDARRRDGPVNRQAFSGWSRRLREVAMRIEETFRETP